MSTPTLAVRTVAVGLLIGVLGMFLTFQRQVGLGFTLFGLIMLGGMIIYARLHRVPFKAHNLIVLLPTTFFTLMLTIRSSSSLTLMNVVGLLIGLTLLVKFFRCENLLKL